ncbi:MAG TPA: glutamine--tRNA ligase/YqeY domain fusion protein [Verrucomicrobiota bacterium]|nr:glutamine--tRNA ligase/YqeY domain fusion protein [Verrucomicrobiota bacterium]HCL92798.1 glutamine--tRNA ligase [Limisphaerales bacterium]HRR64337.1 glutamine--tRNA ligase/YqeY domain fusion protein [Candidatus Paceibacterota bacterium]MBP8015970.1 glutamine--tRNA ligase/YqeY domain fusion protein [Verrucomicrobiota bacterium]MDI9373951.1 glutamine--tRNA ligase/YqeY domain fusion protein [Verrucomicrobiota bacterium]
MANKASEPAAATGAPNTPSDFVRDIVIAHVAEKRYPRIHTRFPPEPNGYLHIGHAKSICLNFGIAREFGGVCNLRMDDTNPTKEDVEYVDSIIEDVKWLIRGWADDRLGLKPKGKFPVAQTVNGKNDFYLGPVTGASEVPLEPFYASDYFDQTYEYAVQLIKKGVAYVDDLSAEDTDKYRGAPDRPGQESPFRNRSIEENLDLFVRMKNGEFPDGARTLRAKIDMTSPNVWMRDPVLYRIRHAEHHHAGAKWVIYPMYDFAHCLSDYLEGITHSICTLEFEVHRPLYDWILEQLDLPRPLPHQYEFARLSLGYTVMSKRKLMQLVNENLVSGWDDPRMPTISGLRRRGVTPEALRDFAYNIGITKYNGITDVSVLEYCIREDLNRRALRRLAVLRPLKVVITNYPEGQVEELEAVNNPEDPGAGKRKVPFSRELYIEREDFMEAPPPKYFRLRPGGEVRLKYAYIIKCDEVIKDAAGQVVELRCTADLGSKTGGPTAARKVKGTVHWVSAAHAMDAEVRLYDRLFTVPVPDASGDFKQHLNPHSLEVVTAKCEPGLKDARPELRYQFERLGYFTLDQDSTPDRRVFNRTIALKDTWAKEARKSA